MTNKTDIITILLGLCFAGYLAVAMGYVAHDGLGLPSEQIRLAATISATLLGALLAMDYLSRKSPPAK
jgi:ABC-type Fe3+-siderophore transport system permease subunit